MDIPLALGLNYIKKLFEAEGLNIQEPDSKNPEESVIHSEQLKKRIENFKHKQYFTFDEDANEIIKSKRELQKLQARDCDTTNDLTMIPVTQHILSIYLREGKVQSMVDMLDVSTFKDGSIFWSGYNKIPSESAQRAAENFMYHGDLKYTNLERTLGGRVVNGWEPLNNSEHYDEFWSLLSEKYAKSASGTVTLVLCPDTIISRGRAVWKRYELPALVKNTNVTQVVVRDLDGKTIETWDKEAMQMESDRNLEELKQQDLL
ncbi:hypothetical protein [Parasitella parasitica]|uniref:Uncharacterized protein n=1 Tax=Parasitella parasitica TaxID=35722 RepID=A0A0B7NHG2_9FUNG|nr:hypothetical protein [Parasitella parasitica]